MLPHFVPAKDNLDITDLQNLQMGVRELLGKRKSAPFTMDLAKKLPEPEQSHNKREEKGQQKIHQKFYDEEARPA